MYLLKRIRSNLAKRKILTLEYKYIDNHIRLYISVDIKKLSDIIDKN